MYSNAPDVNMEGSGEECRDGKKKGKDRDEKGEEYLEALEAGKRMGDELGEEEYLKVVLVEDVSSEI